MQSRVGLQRLYQAILSYCLQHPGRPVDVRTLSIIIGETVQRVMEGCEYLVQDRRLTKVDTDDPNRPHFQVDAQTAARAWQALEAEGLL